MGRAYCAIFKVHVIVEMVAFLHKGGDQYEAVVFSPVIVEGCMQPHSDSVQEHALPGAGVARSSIFHHVKLSTPLQ